MLLADPALAPTAQLAVAYRREEKLFLAELGAVFGEMRGEMAASASSPPLVMELFHDCLSSYRQQKNQSFTYPADRHITSRPTVAGCLLWTGPLMELGCAGCPDLPERRSSSSRTTGQGGSPQFPRK
jgi:hypothetical protein